MSTRGEVAYFYLLHEERGLRTGSCVETRARALIQHSLMKMRIYTTSVISRGCLIRVESL